MSNIAALERFNFSLGKIAACDKNKGSLFSIRNQAAFFILVLVFLICLSHLSAPYFAPFHQHHFTNKDSFTERLSETISNH
jgi:hypothetical protein